MSAAELNGIKLDLIAWIHQLSDAELINFLDGLRVSNDKKDWWQALSEKHKHQISAGLKDAEEGNLIDSKEFWNKLHNA
ncbi:MAG: hypothetical protein HOO86_04695 [Bacteroidales bacterium]|nr:hypothetical protein [Bacteroidales bacterium]